MPPKLGILAGGGDLPAQLISACRASGREFFVLAFKGQANPEYLSDAPHAWSRLGAMAKSLDLLREAGAEELVMAGRVRRPSWSELRPDRRMARMFAKIGLAALGDDRLLAMVVTELEAEGFRLVGPDQLLAHLLAPEGAMGAVEPDGAARGDIARGIEVARGIGRLDVGQAAVIQGGIVLATEAAEGTDAMIARCRELKREGPGPVLVKMSKPGQQRRVDLPTVGPETVAAAAVAGFAGIAVEAGATLVIDRELATAAADQAALFLIGVAVPAPAPARERKK